MNNLEITPVPEITADTTRVCEIRFDCLVTMHDVGYRKYEGMWDWDDHIKNGMVSKDLAEYYNSTYKGGEQ